MSDMFGYAPLTMGQIMVNGINSNIRHEDDFYPTADPMATISLMNVIKPYLDLCAASGDRVEFHEPSCGDGAISRVVESFGYDVLSTDLVYRGYGKGGVDYLKSTETRPFVITNPPFKIAREFVEKALKDGAISVWLLLKSTYFHASGRADLFENTPLYRVMPLSWRIDFTGEGSPTMECCWFEWRAGYKGEPIYGPILKKLEIEKNTEKCENTIDLFK